MSDAKDKVKGGIDDAAQKATKGVAGKVVDKTKDATYEAGKRVEKAGQDIKDAGK